MLRKNENRQYVREKYHAVGQSRQNQLVHKPFALMRTIKCIKINNIIINQSTDGYPSNK